MSRPQTLHTSRIEIALALLAVGLTRRAVARHIGVPESTLRSALARDPLLAERAAQARNLVEADALQKIRSAMSKSWRAAAWFLQHTNPADYGLKRQADPQSPAEYDDLAHVTPPKHKHRAPAEHRYQNEDDFNDDFDDDDNDDDDDGHDIVSAEEAVRQIDQLDQDRPLPPLDINLTVDEPPTPADPSLESPKPSVKSAKSADIPVPPDPAEVVAGREVVAGLPTEPPNHQIPTSPILSSAESAKSADPPSDLLLPNPLFPHPPTDYPAFAEL